MKILSLDGGGVRGVVSLELLKNLQEDTGINLRQDFDVFAGTSTGSIIAMLLACGMNVKEIMGDYEEMSSGVFSHTSLLNLFHSKYDPKYLEDSLEEALKAQNLNKDSCLCDLHKNVVIPVVRLENPRTKTWRLAFRENFTEEGGKIKIIDAILESTAAPTYFPSKKGFVDGGIGMNDPSLAGIMFAYNPEISTLKDIIILSIGAGYEEEHIEGNENWGMPQWLTGVFSGKNAGFSPLISMLMDVSRQIPEQVCSRLLRNSFKKINFPLSKSISLDDYKSIPDLIDYTDQFIRTNPLEWDEYCKWVSTNISLKIKGPKSVKKSPFLDRVTN